MPTKLLLLLALVAAAPSVAQDDEPTARPVVPAPNASRLDYGDATVLGLVEGFTEFLPISSTGHLIVANEALGLNGKYQLFRADGSPAWRQPPTAANPKGVPFTRTDAVDAYTVIIQIGAIAAVVLLYWKRVTAMMLGVLGYNRQGFLLARNIIVAIVPAVIIGLSVGDWIEANLFSVRVVIAALAVGACVMFWVQSWQSRSSWRGTSTREPSDLSLGEAFFAQCVAFWPGMSRSMVTIVAGYLTGLSPAKAAEFSFLLGLPTLAGAAILTGYKHGAVTLGALGWGPAFLGCLIAFVSAAAAIKFLVAALVRFGLGPFAVYRLLFGLGLLLTLGW